MIDPDTLDRLLMQGLTIPAARTIALFMSMPDDEGELREWKPPPGYEDLPERHLAWALNYFLDGAHEPLIASVNAYAVEMAARGPADESILTLAASAQGGWHTVIESVVFADALMPTGAA